MSAPVAVQRIESWCKAHLALSAPKIDLICNVGDCCLISQILILSLLEHVDWNSKINQGFHHKMKYNKESKLHSQKLQERLMTSQNPLWHRGVHKSDRLLSNHHDWIDKYIHSSCSKLINFRIEIFCNYREVKSRLNFQRTILHR